MRRIAQLAAQQFAICSGKCNAAEAGVWRGCWDEQGEANGKAAGEWGT